MEQNSKEMILFCTFCGGRTLRVTSVEDRTVHPPVADVDEAWYREQILDAWCMSCRAVVTIKVTRPYCALDDCQTTLEDYGGGCPDEDTE